MICSSPAACVGVGFTRTTGVEVIRTHTRSWDFPICRRCLHWISLESAARGWLRPFTALLIFGVAAIGIGIALASQGRFDPGMTNRPEVVAVYALKLCGAGLLVLSPLAYVMWLKRHAEADGVKPHPSCSTRPVVYQGWDGSIHTFTFSNPGFCVLFIRANARKVIG
jgi:hypothetical protein